MGLEKLNILCLGEGVSKNLDMVITLEKKVTAFYQT